MRIRSPHEEDYRRYLGDDMISHVMEEDGVLNVKAVVGSFNQEKARDCKILADGSFACSSYLKHPFITWLI